jgi:hypothetical protein
MKTNVVFSGIRGRGDFGVRGFFFAQAPAWVCCAMGEESFLRAAFVNSRK